MSPFYERDGLGIGRRLKRGEALELKGAGPKKFTVEILNDDFALVTPSDGTSVHVGETNPRTVTFKGDTEWVGGRTLLNKESVGRNVRRPDIIWSKK